jgi:AhpD family alkylhydroperoxidase
MSRLEDVEVGKAGGEVKAIFDALLTHAGMVPNIYKGMANSPTALQAAVTIDRLIGEGSLTRAEQAAVKLVVAQHYGSDYCLAVCTTLGAQRGLSAQQMAEIRQGSVRDPGIGALVQFTLRMLETRGAVDDSDVARLHAGGYTDQQMVEVVAIISAVTLGSYFNRMNHTALDFPRAPDL